MNLNVKFIEFYDMALFSYHSFFVLWHSHTMFGTWVYHHGTMCRVQKWPLHDHDLWPQYYNYIFTISSNLARSPLLFDTGILNFGIWVIHHETTCCVHSWPLYDLDLWPICGWRWVFSWVLITVYFFVVSYLSAFFFVFATIYGNKRLQNRYFCFCSHFHYFLWLFCTHNLFVHKYFRTN